MIVGDFNADGTPDLVMGAIDITILLGKGSGTFASFPTYKAGSEAEFMVVADFNGDGKPDLATANYASNSVSILLNQGGGVFQPAVNYAVLKGPFSLAVGDFNGDGKPDLAVANTLSKAVSILLGNGDGTFQPRVDYASGYAPYSVAVGDFNVDGKLDLAVANYGLRSHEHGNVTVLLGNGDGTFQAPVNYPAGDKPDSIAVGDFNNDGIPDLVVADTETSNLVFLPGNGDGTFGMAQISSFRIISSPMTVADLNGDGNLDLVVGGLVLLGNGDGTFMVGEQLPSRRTRPQPRTSMAMAYWISLPLGMTAAFPSLREMATARSPRQSRSSPETTRIRCGRGLQRRRQTGSGGGQRCYISGGNLPGIVAVLLNTTP